MELMARRGVAAPLAAALVLAGCGAPGPSRAPSATAIPSTSASAAPLEPSATAPSATARGTALATARAKHTATLLADGRVLVIGGYANQGLASAAELRDAATGEFTPAGTLHSGRYYHTATLLQDGRVLVVGGSGSDPEILASAELWDPATATFSDAGALDAVRMLHTATLLPDGRVLIVGGYAGGKPIGDAVLWDPSTGRFAPAGTLAHARGWHTATLLPDGRVLIVGGPAAAEIWDPQSTTFSDAGVLETARWWPTATLLGDGRVAVIGGFKGEVFNMAAQGIGAIDAWDPVAHTFTSAGELGERRGLHTATLTAGSILVAGGLNVEAGVFTTFASTELWDPPSSGTRAATALDVARSGHTATLLPDGRVLIVGGSGRGDQVLASTEILNP